MGRDGMNATTDRQTLGDPLPGRTNPLKQHGSNVVDRSFKQTATPVGTPENILGTLLEAAGHVGTAAGTYMATKVDEDKTKQVSNFYNGLAPSDDATVAGYRAHAVLNMSNKTLNSTARLKQEAETFTGSDEEWSQTVAASQTSDYDALTKEYPNIKDDPLASKMMVALYGEQVPALSAARQGFKLAQEHEARITTYEESARVRTEGLTQPEHNAVLVGMLDHPEALQLTRKEALASIGKMAVSRTNDGDLSTMNFLEEHESAYFHGTPALKKAKEAGEQVYWKNHQEVIADYRNTLEKAYLADEIPEDQLLSEMGHANALFANQAYTDTQMTSLLNKPEKATPWANQGAYAKTKDATIKLFRAGKLKGDALYNRAQSDNNNSKAMLWTDEQILALKNEKVKSDELARTTSRLLLQFSQNDKSGRAPLGEQGLDTTATNALIAAAKQLADKTVNTAISRLPANHTPEDERAIRDRAKSVYINHLSKERVKDPEFERMLGSLEFVDMTDSKNMKTLNPHVEDMLHLASTMDEGAKSIHMDSRIRSLYENFQGYVDKRVPRVQALKMAIDSLRNPVMISSDDLKSIQKAGDSFSTGSFKGMLPFTDSNADPTYRMMINAEATAGIKALVLGGVRDVGRAKKMYFEGYSNTHTKLSNGKWLNGTPSVLARSMGVHEGDITETTDLYLEMHREEFEDRTNVPLKEMYISTNPARGTFTVESSVGPVSQPMPLSSLRAGVGAFREQKKKDRKDRVIRALKSDMWSGE